MNIRQDILSHSVISFLLIGAIGSFLMAAYFMELLGFHWLFTHSLYGMGILGLILGMIGMYGMCSTNRGHFILLSLLLNGILFVGEMALLAPLFATGASSGLEAGMFSLFSLAGVAVLCFAMNKLLVDQLLLRIFQPKIQRGYIDKYLDKIDPVKKR